MPARSRAGNARPLRCQRGIEPLTFCVKTLQHRQAFGHAFNKIGFRNVHGFPRVRLSALCAMIAHASYSSHNYCAS